MSMCQIPEKGSLKERALFKLTASDTSSTTLGRQKTEQNTTPITVDRGEREQGEGRGEGDECPW